MSECVLTLACLWDSSSSKDTTLSSATSNGVWPLKTKQKNVQLLSFPKHARTYTRPHTHYETELWLTAVLLLAAELCGAFWHRTSTLPLPLRMHEPLCNFFLLFLFYCFYFPINYGTFLFFYDYSILAIVTIFLDLIRV